MVLHRDWSRCDRKQLSLLTSSAPKRFVASNASVIAIVALCANRVSNRYRIRWGASEKCREHHGILNGAPKRIRTANRQNRNLMRYPVAPWVHICILSFFAVFVERKRTIGVFSTRISGSIETFSLF